MADAFVQPPEGRNFAVAYSPSTSMKPPSSPNQTKAWDDIRREARKLESELEVKLSAYAKLASSYDSRTGRGEAGLAAEQLAQSKEDAIEDLLRRLSDVNDSLSGLVSGSGDARAHTLTRHRDILHDHTQEFRRLRSTYGAARDRAQLFAGSSDSAPMMSGQSGTGLLLRERGNLQNTNTALDDVIGQAEAVSGSLGEQRRIFDNIGNKLVSVSTKFPMVNGIMNAIRRKKSKDTLILSAVITVCTLFLLIYWWRK